MTFPPTGCDSGSGSKALPLRVLTLNTASGRDQAGQQLPSSAFAAALEDLAAVGADVVALQEVDAGQERSGGAHQAALAAQVCGAADWRLAPALLGTPTPRVAGTPAAWRAAGGRLVGPGDDVAEPHYGVALLSRRPVLSWHVLPLRGGRGALRLRAPDPQTGELRWWTFPDEPRVAVAAVLEGGVTVACTHLSFVPVTAVRQLLRVRHWLAQAPGPVRLLVGDLNLPSRVPGLVAGGEPLVRRGTFPASRPRLQLDHVLALQGDVIGQPVSVELMLGDHRPLVVDVRAAP